MPEQPCTTLLTVFCVCVLDYAGQGGAEEVRRAPRLPREVLRASIVVCRVLPESRCLSWFAEVEHGSSLTVHHYETIVHHHTCTLFWRIMIVLKSNVSVVSASEHWYASWPPHFSNSNASDSTAGALLTPSCCLRRPSRGTAGFYVLIFSHVCHAYDRDRVSVRAVS